MVEPSFFPFSEANPSISTSTTVSLLSSTLYQICRLIFRVFTNFNSFKPKYVISRGISGILSLSLLTRFITFILSFRFITMTHMVSQYRIRTSTHQSSRRYSQNKYAYHRTRLRQFLFYLVVLNQDHQR